MSVIEENLQPVDQASASGRPGLRRYLKLCLAPTLQRGIEITFSTTLVHETMEFYTLLDICTAHLQSI